MIPINENTYESHCKACPADVNCCIFEEGKGFTFVGINDAENIKKHTKLEFTDFLEYSALPKKTVDSMKDDDPCLEGSLRYSQLDKKDRILRLKTKKGGRCIFLDDVGRCGIYQARPNICRIYPFWAIRLNDGKIRVIEHDIEPKCGILASFDGNIDKKVTDKENGKIIAVFKEIEKESDTYGRGIPKFLKKSGLL